MAKTLAALESALRERKLDRTLSPAQPTLSPQSSCMPTMVAPLDGCLRGGLPRGQLCEIAGAPSSGRTTLLLQVLASATRRGEIAALVDPGDRLDVTSAALMGVDLERLLWIRGAAAHDRTAAVLPALEQALKALNLVLQAGGFGVVALDLADVPMVALKRLPFTTWLRVQRAIEGSETSCVLVVPEPLARSAGGLTVALSGRAAWTGGTPARRLTGLEIAARVNTPRRYANGAVTFGARVDDLSDVTREPVSW